jgi:hypothetical protein
MIPEHRFDLLAPSEWDVVLSPALAPLFALDAAIVAAHRVLCIGLDPSSSSPGGTGHPPTRALLAAMRSLRRRVRDYRLAEQALADGCPKEPDYADDLVQHANEDTDTAF